MWPAVAPPRDARCFLFGTNRISNSVFPMDETLKEIETDGRESGRRCARGVPRGYVDTLGIAPKMVLSGAVASVPSVLHC